MRLSHVALIGLCEGGLVCWRVDEESLSAVYKELLDLFELEQFVNVVLIFYAN